MHSRRQPLAPECFDFQENLGVFLHPEFGETSTGANRDRHDDKELLMVTEELRGEEFNQP
ncbi:hypothetical protein A3843_10865 [Pseudovibrio exalbescens]|uniref:Uncharacterized protein n=1 Tax=Pseudovibrio exalbescens TaxID=197461 RepID=A0A1U7JH48_9HYPH|nr:hypothetical protein A3843_10865 [Pseudovibrio exalbescens]